MGTLDWWIYYCTRISVSVSRVSYFIPTASRPAWGCLMDSKQCIRNSNVSGATWSESGIRYQESEADFSISSLSA